VATLPICLKVVAESKVCFDRLQKFLLLPEYEHPYSSPDSDQGQNIAVHFSDYSAAREVQNESEGKPTNSNNSVKKGEKDKKEKDEEMEKLMKETDYVQVLSKVDLQVEKGQLVGVAGAVGSGKSSLIAAIMGELNKTKGFVNVKGRLAYVPQQAWIYSGTVRENILFGSQFQQKIFDQVVEASALKPDLENWSKADQTQVGERGLSLSGGQKQRISLARALYAILDDERTEKAEFVVLLDDPLSAVDSSVAKHIFEQAIAKMLNNHTVIFVTHSMQFLSKCDKVVFMKGGSVVEFGTYDQLMKDGKGFVTMTSFDQSKNIQKPKEDSDNAQVLQRAKSVSSDGAEDAQAGQEVTDEKQDLTTVGWSVLLKYFEACGGYLVMFGIMLIVLIFVLVRLFSSVWLQIWLDDGDGQVQERLANFTLNNVTFTDEELRGNIAENPKLWIYQLVHGMSLVILVVIGFCKGFSMATALLKGSSNLHERMLKRVMRCPMSFF